MSTDQSISQRLANWITGKPLKALSLGLALLIFLSIGIPSLTADFSYRVWFKESNPRLQAFDAFERKFGSDDIALIGIYSKSGIFDKDSAQLLVDLTEDLWLVPEVIRVDSLANFNWVHGQGDEILVDPFLDTEEGLTDELLKQRSEVARNHRNIQGYLISEDQNTSLAYLSLKPSLKGKPDYEKVNKALRKIVDKYTNSEKYQQDHQFYITGSPALTFGFQESSQADMQKLIPLVFLITLIFLGYFFRSVSGVILSVVVMVTSIVATLGFSGWIGSEMNVMTAIIPQFLIALSIAVIVHLLVSFFQFVRKGLSRKEAMMVAIEKNLTPTLLTSISTAIGFLTYTTSDLLPIAKLGILAGAGTLLAWAFSFFIVAPVICLLPGSSAKKAPLDEGNLLKPSDRSYRLTDSLNRFRIPVILFYILVAMTSLYFASKTPVSSDPYDYFADDFPLTIANNFIEDNVGGSMGIEAVIESGEAEGIKDPQFLSKANEFQNWVEDHEFITKTVSVVDILKEMNQTLEGGDKTQYRLADNRELLSQQLFLYTMNLPQGMDINNRVTINNDAIRLTSMTLEHQSDRFMKFIDKMVEKGKSMGLDVWVTGKGPLYQSNNELVVSSFKVSLSLAIFLVGILMILGLGSLRIGLMSLIPNTLPLLIGSGFVYFYGGSLDIGTVIVGSVCLGIAVDDTIHFLANYQRFRGKGDSPREAIAKVFTNTVPALITTTVVLVAAFGCFVFASFVPNQNFGVFVAVILVIALITDLMLLPAILLTLDKEKKV